MKLRAYKGVILGCSLVLGGASVGAHAAPLRVVTTIPALASLAVEVGGAEVQADSLTRETQNPHGVVPDPTLLFTLGKADLFVQNGLDLEVAWAPGLLEAARNAKIRPGSDGLLDVSSAIIPLEVSSGTVGSGGHPRGNPHYLSDPENARLVARLIFERLSDLRPEGTGYFRGRLENFEKRLDVALAAWSAALAPAQGKTFVSYHRSWTGFARRFGLVSLGELEPEPGQPPSPGHTAELVARMKEQSTAAVLTEPWYESRTPAFVARQTGARVVTMSLGSAQESYLAALGRCVSEVAESFSAVGLK